MWFESYEHMPTEKNDVTVEIVKPVFSSQLWVTSIKSDCSNVQEKWPLKWHEWGSQK